LHAAVRFANLAVHAAAASAVLEGSRVSMGSVVLQGSGAAGVGGRGGISGVGIRGAQTRGGREWSIRVGVAGRGVDEAQPAPAAGAW
jgi:hypothetical protein